MPKVYWKTVTYSSKGLNKPQVELIKRDPTEIHHSKNAKSQKQGENLESTVKLIK